MNCRSLISLAATVLMAGTFAACGGSSSSTGSTTGTSGGSCTTSTASTANSTTFVANMANITTNVPVSPGARTTAFGGDIEAPCSAADYDYAFFHTAAVQGNQLGAVLGLISSLDTTGSTVPGACPGPAPLGDPSAASASSKPSVVQGGLNESLNSGALGLGFTLTSKDSTFMSDTCAGLSIVPVSASPATTVTGDTPTQFAGSITSTTLSGETYGKFTSASPTAGDVQFDVALPVIPGAAPIALPLHAVQITAYISGGKIQGQINGALLVSDLPALVQGVINGLSSLSPGTQAIVIGMLDSGNGDTPSCVTAAMKSSVCSSCAAASGTTPGCCVNAGTGGNPDTCSSAKDGQIGVCEVLCSGVGSLLKADIQIHSSTGAYAPVAGGTTPDALSVGVGFTAPTGSF